MIPENVRQAEAMYQRVLVAYTGQDKTLTKLDVIFGARDTFQLGLATAADLADLMWARHEKSLEGMGYRN